MGALVVLKLMFPLILPDDPLANAVTVLHPTSGIQL